MPSFARLFAVLAGLTTLALSGASPTAIEKRDVHIAVGGKSGLYYLPLTIAEKLGYFEAEGLRVRISDFAGGSAALRAVVGGSADVVTGSFEHTIALREEAELPGACASDDSSDLRLATPRASSFRSFRGPERHEGRVSAPGRARTTS
jgi:NitT/TauT family transport system substrate-binding protein